MQLHRYASGSVRSPCWADRAAWLQVLAQAADQQGRAGLGACPDCGRDTLQVRYIVNPDSRVGYALLWCGACLHGISVSRVWTPEGMRVWSLDDPASVDGVPGFTRHE